MTDELVDHEGYPRADVDILTVRKTRVRIICKFCDFQNVFILILKEFEKIFKQCFLYLFFDSFDSIVL